jgi:hypothetical protein
MTIKSRIPELVVAYIPASPYYYRVDAHDRLGEDFRCTHYGRRHMNQNPNFDLDDDFWYQMVVRAVDTCRMVNQLVALGRVDDANWAMEQLSLSLGDSMLTRIVQLVESVKAES